MGRGRDDIELGRALRQALLAVEDARAETLRHLARSYALAAALREPRPEADVDVIEAEARFAARAAAHLETLREVDAADPRRLQLGDAGDKYAVVTDSGPPCAELIPLCQGRCCSFDFALSSQDLDEGRIEWDRSRPYLIRHGDDGYCVHCDPDTRGCDAYHHRPTPCRTFDCRDDPRVWLDYEARLPAPLGVADPAEWSTPFNLLDRLRRRDQALAAEAAALRAPGPSEPR